MTPTIVSINGIVQSPYDYEVTSHSIMFRQAPPAAADVNVYIQKNNITYMGNGSNCVFQIPYELRQEVQFKEFAHQVWKNRDNPSVKDQLEKLKIIMELVR